MKLENATAVEAFCAHHKVEAAFIHALHQTGLIEVATIEGVLCISHQQLPYLERYIDFHYTLDINLAGIETISHLLHRLNALQTKVVQLENQLQFYEKK